MSMTVFLGISLLSGCCIMALTKLFVEFQDELLENIETLIGYLIGGTAVVLLYTLIGLPVATLIWLILE